MHLQQKFDGKQRCQMGRIEEIEDPLDSPRVAQLPSAIQADGDQGRQREKTHGNRKPTEPEIAGRQEDQQHTRQANEKPICHIKKQDQQDALAGVICLQKLSQYAGQGDPQQPKDRPGCSLKCQKHGSAQKQGKHYILRAEGKPSVEQ